MPHRIQFLPESADRVLIVSNPTAGSRPRQELVAQLARQLRTDGFAVELIDDLDVLAERTRCRRQDGLRAIVAAGGDGTVSSVVNSTAPDTPVVVLPLGTENLLAKYLGIGASPQQIRRLILAGATVRLDAGRAGQRIFLLMAGCGFDAEVVRRLHSDRKGHIQHLSYAKPILDSIRSYGYPELRVYCDPPGGADGEKGPPSQRVEDPLAARWVFVVNLPRYAAGLQFVPEAVGTDGLLDICTFRDGSFLSGLKYLAGIVLGQHRQWQDCITRQARKLRIESDSPVPYQLDGDPGGQLPVEIESLPGRLNLLVDRQWALRNGFETTGAR